MANGFQSVAAQETFTVMGNSPDEKAIGSIAELQVKRMLENSAFFEQSFRNTATAEQIQKIGGIATAIYRFAKRLVWGTKYDYDTGAKRKRSASTHTTFRLNKFMNVKFMIEEYDLQLFREGNPSVRAELVGQWVGSLTKNLIMNKELVFKQAVKTWAIAHYDAASNMPTVLVVDKNEIKQSKDAAIAWQMNLLELMTKKLKIVNDTTIGTNMNEWNLSISYELYNALLPAFTQFIDETGAKALVTGSWYQNSTFGFPIFKDINLQMAYNSDDETIMNDNVSYDLTGVDGMIVHNSDWANPDALEFIRQVIDPETTNIQWVGKYLGSLPMSLRQLSTIIMDHEPTAEEVAEAKSHCVPVDQDMGSEDDWETYRVQLSLQDKLDSAPVDQKVDLSTIITTTDLGELADNTNDTILGAAVVKNPTLVLSEVSIDGAATDTGATIKSNDGSTKYKGSVPVTFTIKAAEKSFKSEYEQSQKSLKDTQSKLEELRKANEALKEAKKK